MSINTWSPDSENTDITASALELKEYIDIGASDAIVIAVENLSAKNIHLLTTLIKQDSVFWQTAAKNLSTENIIHLMRFFTLAEEKHSALFAGKEASVIGLNKVLKIRKTPLPKEELLWIKAHTTNRYLPNGSVL